MPSVRGPRRCAITFASTSMPSTAGFPTFTSSPWLNSRTRAKLTDEPGSAARRSTRIRSPRATRYCFPPLTITADGFRGFAGTGELSGFGTATEFTKTPPHSWGGGLKGRRGRRRSDSPHDDRGGYHDRQHEHREWGDASSVK